MSDTYPIIKCRNCRYIFQPDMMTNENWPCPICQFKNPNLKRHYRSVADICILSLIATPILIAVGFIRTGLNLAMILLAAHAIAHAFLLLVTIIFIYKSKTPWANNVVKALIWTVFGLAFFFNVVLPLVLAGRLNIPFIIVYAFVFPYLFWLNSQAGKCRVSGPLVASRTDKSGK